MNERIRKLAEQNFYYGVWEGDGVFTGQVDLEKFAELIIRECIDICEKQEYEYWRSSEEQEFTPIDCADRIKHHFGVKE